MGATLNGVQQVMTGSLVVGSAITSDGRTVGRLEVGDLLANGISPAQSGWRINDLGGNVIADSLGLVGVAGVIATDSPGAQNVVGVGSGWTTVQTIPGSGANFTLNRQGNILVLSTLSWFWSAGSIGNYTAVYHSIYVQGGALVSRKQVTAAGNVQNLNYFMSPSSVFFALPAGNYTFKLEFALDSATTAATFGGGATGIPPVSEVVRLGG